MRVFNTATRRLEEVAALDGNHVRLYTCGPTVYDMAHIGNFRTYVFEDLLRRHLRFSGFRVTQVMNLTDVDDKTIRGARRAGCPLGEFTRPFREAFFEDLRTLNIQAAEHYPAATEHVPEMIELIRRLLGRGHAYVSDDRSVYFDVSSFPGYGKLAHLDLSGLRAGARVAHDEYAKESVADFALWKAWDEADGEVAWDSPWGRGRPGWHIECSAMSMKYLGESFDIHTGGVDNMFPHHENEIAQSEGATGRPFVRYWMHSAHLMVDGAKMSKSLGNFHTLRDVTARGYAGREVRYVLLAGHYRQSLNFTFDALAGARSALARLDEFRERLRRAAGAAAVAPPPEWAGSGRAAFVAAMDDDLNAPEALGALFELVRQGNRAMDEAALSAGGAAGVLALLDEVDRILGCLQPADAAPPAEALALLDKRREARKAKNWAESDRIRDRLAALGWVVQDTPEGPRWKRR